VQRLTTIAIRPLTVSLLALFAAASHEVALAQSAREALPGGPEPPVLYLLGDTIGDISSCSTRGGRVRMTTFNGPRGPTADCSISTATCRIAGLKVAEILSSFRPGQYSWVCGSEAQVDAANKSGVDLANEAGINIANKAVPLFH
jgi:hypothetical protein